MKTIFTLIPIASIIPKGSVHFWAILMPLKNINRNVRLPFQGVMLKIFIEIKIETNDETMIETPILASSLIATSAKIEKQR